MSHHQSVAQHQTHQEMPNCDGMARGSMRKCDLGAKDAAKNNVVNVGLFVLFAPTRILRSATQVSVVVAAPQLVRALSSIPETPPPRVSIS